MGLPLVVSQAEWLIARTVLLTKEKAMTHQRDELNTERRTLPMVEITKDYDHRQLTTFRVQRITRPGHRLLFGQQLESRGAPLFS